MMISSYQTSLCYLPTRYLVRRLSSGVSGLTVQEFEGKIREYVSADQHRNAASLLSLWLQQVKSAYVKNGQHEDIFHDLVRGYDYKLPKVGFLLKKKKPTPTPTHLPAEQIKTAQDFTKALRDQRFDTLTVDKSTFDLRHFPSTEKIPMHVWTYVMRLYAHRGAFGKASRLFTFVHHFHNSETSLLFSTEKYGQSILDGEVGASESEHVHYRLCAYYALSAAAAAQHKQSADAVLHLLAERQVVLDNVLKAVLWQTHGGAVGDVSNLMQRIYDDLLVTSTDNSDKDDYARARVILRHAVRYLCALEQYDEAHRWVKVFSQRARASSLALPYEALEDAMQAFTSRHRVDLAVDLSSQFGSSGWLYDAAARTSSSTKDVKQLQDLVMQSRKMTTTSTL